MKTQDAISVEQKNYVKETALFIVIMDLQNKQLYILDSDWKNAKGTFNEPYYYIRVFEELAPELVNMNCIAHLYPAKGVPSIGDCFDAKVLNQIKLSKRYQEYFNYINFYSLNPHF